MKRSERLSAIVKILSDSPNQAYSLSYFCQLFDSAKSSISEDLQAAKQLLAKLEIGIIETTSGAGGGVRFIPYISNSACLNLQNHLCERLKDPSRRLAGGFLYTSDIMFDANLMKKIACAFARKFQNAGADYVVTIETKGIALATMVSDLLHIPMPSRKMGEGDFRDIAHPLVSETRNKIKDAIFAEYEKVLNEKVEISPTEVEVSPKEE